MIDEDALDQAWTEYAVEETLKKKPREFWILQRWSPYHLSVWNLANLSETEMGNLNNQFGEDIIHVREVLGE